MSKLLRANMKRLLVDKVFWLCMAAMFIIGIAIGIMSGGSEPEDFRIDRTFFSFCLPLEFVCAVFCSLFVGTEYGDGTLRNKIIVGHSRKTVYLSNLIVCMLAGLALEIAYMIPMLIVGTARLGWFEMGTAVLLTYIGISIMMAFAISALFVLIGMLCQNKASIAVLCMIGVLGMVFASAYINACLQEPETYDNYVYMDGSGQMQEAPAEANSNYLTGTKREIYQFALELLPTGQAIIFVEHNFVHIWQLPVYSLSIIIVSTMIGILLFRKKDLK